MRNLRRGVDDQFVVERIVLGEDSPALHRSTASPLDFQPQGFHVGRFGQGLVRVADVGLQPDGQVVVELVMDERRSRCQGLARMVGHGQDLILGPDRLERVFGGGAAFRNGHRDRLPDELDLGPGEGDPVVPPQIRMRNGRGKRLPEIAEVFGLVRVDSAGPPTAA